MQITAASWPRYLLVATLLSPAPCLAQSDTVPLVIGSHRTPQPDRLELLLELPTGIAKVQPREIQLLEDARATAQASAVNGFRETGWTVSTVLAIDTSRSMTRYLAPVRAALPEFVAKLQPNDTIALITFDDAVHALAPFGAPRDQLGARIGTLSTAGSKTLLHQAVDQSLTMLEGRSADRTRRRTLVISDGSDEGSGNPSVTDDIIRRAVRLNVAIDTIWLGQPVAARRDTLVRFAERSGGIHREAITAESAEADVKAALNAINSIAANAVVASFERQIQTDANTREIGVSLARPGIATATVPLQIPRSAVPGPPTQTQTPPSRRDLIVRWTIRLLPALPAIYGAYVLIYLIAKRRNPNRKLLNPMPWRKTPLPVVIKIESETPKPSPSPRVTMVAPERPAAGAGGISHGLALDAVAGPLRGQRVTVAGPRFHIGADNNNELRVTTDQYLSGMHARIEHSQGQWTLIDQGSSNGTFVDGRRLASGQAHPLHDGESIRVGASEFRVMIACTPAAARAGRGAAYAPPAYERPIASTPSAPAGGPRDPVLLGVSAPRQAKPGMTFTTRFAAYIQEREDMVVNQLRTLDANGAESVQTVVGLPPSRGGRWLIGTPVTVRVSGAHLQVNPESQSFEWNGTVNFVSFLVSVPERAPNVTTQLCFEAFIEAIPVAFIPLNLVIGRSASVEDPVTATARPMSSAFACYASKDAAVVALLLSALKRWDPHADVFMDCLDLTPNQDWRKELERLIPSKDWFLLFWSINASRSPWVEWELQHARSSKGIDWIRPMPIDDPETAPPPDFLQHLHFRDKYLIARQAFLRLQKRP